MTQRAQPQGRPRDSAIDTRATGAVLHLLERIPYRELTLEAIAAEAGTSKPALRRRWKSLQGVVVQALISTLGTTPTPNTGCLHCDLIVGITNLADAFGSSPITRALPGLISDLANDAELRERFMRDYFQTRRNTTRTVLAKAVERGEINADIDLELTLDLLGAPLYHRAFFGHQPLSGEVAERTVMTVLNGIATPAWKKHHRAD